MGSPPGVAAAPTPVLIHRIVGIPSSTSVPIAVAVQDAATVRIKVGTDAGLTQGVAWSSPVVPDANG